MMTHAAKRSILRWVHIIFVRPLIGFVYGPPRKLSSTAIIFGMPFCLSLS